MPVRIFAALIGAANLANGLFAALFPERWFLNAPGASSTGPFNSHFVTDVGLGFAVAGIAFLIFAWRPRYRLLALGASGFVVLHGLFHLANLAFGHHVYAVVDIQIALLAFTGLALCLPRNAVHQERSA